MAKTPGLSLTILPFAALVFLASVVYIPSLGNDFIWDDDQYVTANTTLRSVDGLRRIWLDLGATPQYYPMVFTTFWIEYRLWGLEPAGFHAMNVVLHGLGAACLWLVLRRLHVAGAFVAAAVFAVHPVHVESVAWITERKNVLSALFYFLAACSYLRFAPPLEPGESSLERAVISWTRYALALVLFALALFSKTVTCSLPAALLVVYWWKQGRILRRQWLPLVPMLILGLALGLITAWMERQHVWGGRSEYDYSLLERTLIAGRVVWFYAAKLVWPAGLTFIYPRWTIDASQWWQWLYPISAAGVVIALWLARNRIGRGPVAAVCIFGGTLFPALGFFDVYPFRFSFVADHFQHLASVSLSTLLVAAAASALARTQWWRPTYIAALSAAMLIPLAVACWRQQAIYRNLETLWTDTLAKNDGAWLAHSNLGAVLADAGRIDEAINHYHRALELHAGYPHAHYNLANALALKGQSATAIEHYRAAIEGNPRFVEAHFNLARTLLQEGADAQALEEFEAAARHAPRSSKVRLDAAVILAEHGDSTSAVHYYREVIAMDSTSAEAHAGLAMALWDSGSRDQAIEHFRSAARHARPQAKADGFLNLGVATMSLGMSEEGLEACRTALRLNPALAADTNVLGERLAAGGRSADAARLFEAVLEIAPNDPRARANLDRLAGH